MDSVAGKWSPKDSQVAGSQGADGVGVGAAHPGEAVPEQRLDDRVGGRLGLLAQPS